MVGQPDQHRLVGVAERPRCTTAHVEEPLDLSSHDDGHRQSAADAFRVDRLGVLRRHQRPRDAFGGSLGPAADSGLTADAQTGHDTKALIGLAASSDDVPGRERAVGVTHRQARHVGAAERVGATRDPREHRVQVMAFREVAGDIGQRLSLAATALGVSVKLGALDRDRGMGTEGRQHLHLGGAEVRRAARDEREDADEPPVREERNRRAGSHASRCEVGAVDRARVREHVGHEQRP
ncbi:MAG TPA: hypothetical protein VIF11_02880, partial [Methylomirabilota bacterium]